MKRINYLFALALPALMAACTQEELVTSDAGNNGLNLVENPIENFSLEANIGGDPETRVTDNEYFEVGDKMGLVWFNPYYISGGQKHTLNSKEFYANNQLTISKENGDGVWNSDAVIMEGKHFAYLPFQTIWENQEEYPLQVKGGQEALKVYNETTQLCNPTDRHDWMVNHQVYLSPVYEFTEGKGAGISDDRRVDLYLFSNRLNITPEFINEPTDLTVYGYELKTVHNFNSVCKPFVTKAEILANKLPMSKDLGGCNWASMNNANLTLANFYAPVAYADALEVSYGEATVNASDAPKFTFLLLPVTTNSIRTGNSGLVKASKIVMVAHTNYGDITIENVTGKFDENTTTEGEISLSKLYYNADNINGTTTADRYVGFVDNAGTTRGNGTGANGVITATFDFETIELALPEVCNNATLNRALQMIKNYKKALGDVYTTEEIVLCKQPTFSNLAFTEKIEATEKATGVEITVTGQEWTDDKGNKHFSEITWKGNSSIAQRIPLTVNIVAEGATLTAEVEGNGLTGTTVYGTLENNGAAEKVTVEERGLLNNNNAVTELYNYGKVYNNPAETSAPEDQAEIFNLYNYGTVYNYGRIQTVQANNNADADNENTAKIVLMNNENTEDGEAIGAIFNIEHIAGGVMDAENNIEYTVEKSDAVKAGAQFAVALNNKATNIFVADGADISATASQQTLNGKRFAARITFNGTSTYTFASSAQFENVLKVAEVVLAEGAKVEFENQLANSGVFSDIYALATDKFIMNNASELTLDKKVLIAAATLFIEPNSTVTINTHETDSKLYYIYKSQIQSEIKGVNSINEMPENVKEAFGWE